MRLGFTKTSIRLCVSGLLALNGCSLTRTWDAQSRVDPLTVAVYPGTQQIKSGPALKANQRAYAKKPATKPTPSEIDNANCPALRLKNDSHTGVIDLDCFRFPDEMMGFTAYQRATQPGPDQRNYRDRLVSIIVKQSDNICTSEMGTLTANEAVFNSTFSTLTTGLAAASTIVGGQQAKTILSGLATVVSGTRDHINVHVYRNQIAQAVIKAIEGERDKKLSIIYSNMNDTNLYWNVDELIREADDYHRQCSFYKGLELVVTAVDNKKAYDDLMKAHFASDASIKNVEARAECKTEIPEIAKQLKQDSQNAELKKSLTALQVRCNALIAAAPAEFASADEAIPQSARATVPTGSGNKKPANPAMSTNKLAPETTSSGAGSASAGADGTSPAPPRR